MTTWSTKRSRESGWTQREGAPLPLGHDVPDCTSDELYKGIVAGKATGVFNGKVFVKQDAQRTRAYQRNANILQKGFHFSTPDDRSRE